MSANQKLFVILVILLALLGVSCGGENSTPNLEANDISPQQILAEFGALAMPPGVDPDTWEQVTAAFAKAVNNPPKQPMATGDNFRVVELGFEIQADASAELSWTYINRGDYDQNGEVNAADIGPIAIYFLENSQSLHWPVSQVADGDGNGEVNLADVTTLAVNYGNTVTGYEVQTSSVENGGPWESVAFVPFSQGTLAEEGGRRKFFASLAGSPNGSFFRVVPALDRERTLFEDAQSAASPYFSNVWGMEGGNPMNQSSSLLPGPDGLALHWSVDLGGSMELYQPVIGTDGTVYVVSNSGDISAVSPDGEIKWTTNVGFVKSTPAVTPDGRVLVPGANGVALLSHEGEILDPEWIAFPYGEQTLIDCAGQIYLADDSGRVGVYNPAGNLVWQHQEQASSMSIAVYEGLVYCLFDLDGQRTIWAYDTDGSVLWEKPVDPYFLSEIAISPEGTVLLHHFFDLPNNFMHPVVVAISPEDGTELWTYESDLNYIGMAVCADGTIRLESMTGEIICLDASGNPLWFNDSIIGQTLEVNWGESFDSHSVDVNGQLFTMAFSYEPEKHVPQNKLFSVTDGGARNWTHQLGEHFQPASAPVIGLGQTLFFLDPSHTLHAFGPEGQVPPPAPTGVQATNGAYNDRVEIIWNPSPGALSYQVYREDSDLPVGVTTATNWVDSSIETSPIAYFVTAVNEIGESAASERDLGEISTLFGDPGPGYWNQPNGNANGTSLAVNDGPVSVSFTGSLQLESQPLSSPVFGSDGTLYLSLENKVIAVRNLDLLWEFDGLQRNPSSLAVGQGGRIYFFMQDLSTQFSSAELYCLGNNRIVEWKKRVSSEHSDLTIDSNGIVYFGESDGSLTALHPDGLTKWKFETNSGRHPSSPTIGPDGTVYFECGIGQQASRVTSQGAPKYYSWIYALNPDGSLKWTYQGLESGNRKIAVSSQNIVYMPGHDWEVLALNPDGSLLWDATLPFPKAYALALGPQDEIYIQTPEKDETPGYMLALDPTDGTQLWTYELGLSEWGFPITGQNGTIYSSGRYNNTIYAIAPGGTEQWTYEVENPLATRLGMYVSIGNDGVLYFTDDTGMLHWIYGN